MSLTGPCTRQQHKTSAGRPALMDEHKREDFPVLLLFSSSFCPPLSARSGEFTEDRANNAPQRQDIARFFLIPLTVPHSCLIFSAAFSADSPFTFILQGAEL